MFNAYDYSENATPMYNYIVSVGIAYANAADKANKHKDYKAMYACNKMFNHYMVMARLYG